ncbi:MMPL family RND transporter, partial [Mycobacterium kansasii]
HYLPLSAPANQGQEAANRHFSEARMNPDLLMVESNHDMRNPADMLVLDRVAKNEMRTLGIAMVQDITRPLGIPIQHSSIPFQNSVQSQTTMQNMGFLKERMNDILKMADDLQTQIDTTQRQYEVSLDLANAADDSAKTTQVTSQITDSLRDHIADFDDTFRPVRTYFYWEKHCYDIPVCIGLRSLFDTFDGFDQLAQQFHYLTTDITHTAKASRDLTELFPTLIATLKTTRGITLTLYQTFK